MDEILVFVKYPRPGRVKTRLAAALGTDRAAELYRSFVEMLLARLRDGGLDPVVLFDPQEPEARYREWLGEGRYRAQRGADLGRRMAAALQESLDGGARRAVLIGSDSPHLPPARLHRAFQALEVDPVVLGPCADGGYYLVGVRESVPDLFDGIPWSTPGVLQATLARAGALPVALLEEDFDVDTPEDLERLRVALTPPS